MKVACPLSSVTASQSSQTFSNKHGDKLHAKRSGTKKKTNYGGQQSQISLQTILLAESKSYRKTTLKGFHSPQKRLLKQLHQSVGIKQFANKKKLLRLNLILKNFMEKNVKQFQLYSSDISDGHYNFIGTCYSKGNVSIVSADDRN